MREDGKEKDVDVKKEKELPRSMQPQIPEPRHR